MKKVFLSEKKLIPLDHQFISKLQQVRVVYTDLDKSLLGPGGSLLTTAKGNLTTKVSESLVNLLESGIEVVAVSGRTTKQLTEMARLLSLDSFITELGCFICFEQGRHIISNFCYPCKNNQSLYQAIKDSGAADLLLSRFSGRLEYHTPWSESRLGSHLFRGQISLDEANALLNSHGYQNLYLCDNGIIRNKGKLIGVATPHAYHLLPAGVSKKSAIARHQAISGYKPDEVVAIGDSLVDLQMAEQAAFFFLINNSEVEWWWPTLEAKNYHNVYLADQKMNLGWLEIANLLIKAKNY